MLIVDELQSGTGVDVARGDVLAIRLRENASTGYRWALDNADGLALEQSDNAGTDAGAGAGGAPGAAGLREFRFRAVAPGTHQLRLKHGRDWQGDGSVIGHFLLNVRVV